MNCAVCAPLLEAKPQNIPSAVRRASERDNVPRRSARFARFDCCVTSWTAFADAHGSAYPNDAQERASTRRAVRPSALADQNEIVDPVAHHRLRCTSRRALAPWRVCRPTAGNPSAFGSRGATRRTAALKRCSTTRGTAFVPLIRSSSACSSLVPRPTCTAAAASGAGVRPAVQRSQTSILSRKCSRDGRRSRAKLRAAREACALGRILA